MYCDEPTVLEYLGLRVNRGVGWGMVFRGSRVVGLMRCIGGVGDVDQAR